MSLREILLISELSGWLLPEGRFYPTKEWWHISGLYDLKDEQFVTFQSCHAKKIFGEGDEMKIRNYVSSMGFIKISPSLLDGEFMNQKQLITLKSLLKYIDPLSEFDILSASIGFVKKLSVQRILKIKHAEGFFKL